MAKFFLVQSQGQPPGTSFVPTIQPPSTIHLQPPSAIQLQPPSTIQRQPLSRDNAARAQPKAVKVKIFYRGERTGKTFAMRRFNPDEVETPSDLEKVIRKEFQKDLGAGSGRFSGLGYIKGKSKITFRSEEDVSEAMESIRQHNDVTLWCSYTSPPPKKDDECNGSSSEEEERSRQGRSKRKKKQAIDYNASKDGRIADIICRLRENHGRDYTAIQCCGLK
eukprot:m.265153 g.265153  ORF g.265153 m.265153 type:complete len:221 (+) comp40483_c0_seq1:6658-7320(+)